MLFKRVFGALILILLLVVLGAIIIARQLGVSGTAPVASLSPAASETPSSAQPSSTSTPTPSADPYADRPDIDLSSWEYTLVNKDNLLGADYVPEMSTVTDGQYFDSRAADALKDFIDAAKAEGLTVYITSSYRSYETQEYLFNKKVNEYLYSSGSQEAAVEKAKTIVAYPGTSEHQLGLACDIVDKYYEYMDESIENTPLAMWMAVHCAEYGFILRYPEDKTDITGVMYEPWHFRYVGVQAAEYIMRKGLALEEFIALYI
ncbi:MAG: M15 family metallopeptidase [Oscillospiraceae bacterium]|nr:M15 family metallopeptidase [Oscillospiraceae bacterium]